MTAGAPATQLLLLPGLVAPTALELVDQGGGVVGLDWLAARLGLTAAEAEALLEHVPEVEVRHQRRTGGLPAGCPLVGRVR